jgi:hypothetical protein
MRSISARPSDGSAWTSAPVGLASASAPPDITLTPVALSSPSGSGVALSLTLRAASRFPATGLVLPSVVAGGDGTRKKIQAPPRCPYEQPPSAQMARSESYSRRIRPPATSDGACGPRVAAGAAERCERSPCSRLIGVVHAARSRIRPTSSRSSPCGCSFRAPPRSRRGQDPPGSWYPGGPGDHGPRTSDRDRHEPAATWSCRLFIRQHELRILELMLISLWNGSCLVAVAAR